MGTKISLTHLCYQTYNLAQGVKGPNLSILSPSFKQSRVLIGKLKCGLLFAYHF